MSWRDLKPKFHTGGTIPALPDSDDEVPALLSEGCVYLTPREADALDRCGVTPEMLPSLNTEERP
jgi:hypothetical protein